MGFANDSGYTPSSIEDLMILVMGGVNAQFGTAYTYETFIGTNFYKYYYALIQRLQSNEVKTSEIFLLLQNYFTVINARISRPVVTNPGLIEAFALAGWVASIKKPIDADAGKLFICVDVDETAPGYAAEKLAINTLIKNSTALGIPTQGTEVSTIVLSNAQAFDFKFKLPNRITVNLRLTLTLSVNNQVVILAPEDVKQKLIENIEANYRLGRDFEPERYFSVSDAPWAGDVLLEWSDDAGATWHDETYTADYDDLFVISLANITLVEA